MITANIFTESFLVTLGFGLAVVVCLLIGFIGIGLIVAISGEKKEDKKDEFDWTYQDEKCFEFAYYKDDTYRLVCISKDKLKSLLEDKNIDLLYENESK